MLTNTDLADMREAIAELLPATCHILSVTRTSDGQGGFTDTWGTATANVACRLDYQQGVGRRGEMVVAASMQPYNGFVLSLPWNSTITAANRIKIGSTNYNVTMVDNGKSWAAVRRAALEAI
jgi:head-tail adaptor